MTIQVLHITIRINITTSLWFSPLHSQFGFAHIYMKTALIILDGFEIYITKVFNPDCLFDR